MSVEPSIARRVARATSATVLLLFNLVTAFFVWLALATPQPSGPADTDALDGVAMEAGIGMGLALLSMMLTTVGVGVDWLARWWLLIPAALFVLALVRFHALPTYPV